MRLTRLLAIATLVVVVPIGMANAQEELLDDGAFDDAVTGTQTSNSAWVLTTNFPDGVSDAGRFQTGFANANNTGVGGTQPPGTGTGIWFRSFEGDQGNGGDPLADTTLIQDVIAPSDGNYLLTFVAGREANHISRDFSVTLSSSGTGAPVSVDLNAAAIPDGNLGGAASTNPGGTPFALQILGVTAGDTLTVTAVNLGGEDTTIPGGQSAFLDNFSLSVPEPTSALLASLTLMGFAVRRRR